MTSAQLKEPTASTQGVSEFCQEERAGQPEDVAWMQPESLTRLAAALNTVRRLCPELPVLAIPWMHMSHPIHKTQERFLRGEGFGDPAAPQTGGRQGWAASLRSSIRVAGLVSYSALYAMWLSHRLARLQLCLRREIAGLKRKHFDLIAKTWCFGVERPRDDRDFYYGDLQAKSARRGVQMLLLCGDVTGCDWKTFAQGQLSTEPLCRIPELSLVHPFRPIQMLAQQLRSALRLRRLGARMSDPLTKEICRQAGEDCLSAAVTRLGLLFWVAQTAVRRWQPRAFVTLYEGRGWERCAWLGVKAAGFPCRTVGYQHTVVFRECLSLTQPSPDGPEGSLPDVVLCLGQAPLELMRLGHERYGVRMMNFGSFRHRGATAKHAADPARRTVLVTPEGIASEVKFLFSFASACAQRLPGYRFILRSHPELPMRRALELAGCRVGRHSNMVVSENRSIDEDFARASVLMYRGSSSVLYAIANGLLPIFVSAETAINSDPVYALNTWRKCCGTPDEAVNLLRHYEQAPVEEREAEWRAAAQYVQDYLIPVEDARIEQFFKDVGIEVSRSP
ncbi:MAG: hypothetical protein A3D28_02795 [Omnitrophica bacterium RIFCSPHIGHO2_02_FULL_63_14]|nr:MAG: hypothetical protein A3D28_02795 [Omnitrophica bacterium RIFCSPHIGHO2_02_FULL_63_14]